VIPTATPHAATTPHFGGEGVHLRFLPEVNGVIDVDILPSPWPDSMGSPTADMDLFGAWTMGAYGPFTFSGNLERAAQHPYEWNDAPKAASAHTSIVRVRSSYAVGADPDALVIPESYDSKSELMMVTQIARSLLDLPHALAYFNPNGEMLLNKTRLQALLDEASAQKLLPLAAWTNARVFRVDANWTMMDVVGNGQIDLPDLEVLYPAKDVRGSDARETFS